MSIAAINEQLLRAIGVGVALVDLDAKRLRFANDTFTRWFAPATPDASLAEIMPNFDLVAMQADLAAGSRHSAEVSFKLKRRTMSVAVEVNRALDGPENIVVLVCQNITRIKELESMIDSYSMMVERNTHELKREKEQVEKLLLNMMPRAAYEEYKTFGVVAPRVFDSVSILTLDFVDFDTILAANDPAVIVSELNDLYTAFDRIGEQFGCARVRTNGDSYFAVSGVPDPVREHAESVAQAALRFLRYLARRNETHPIRWNARIGLATGPVIGSVVGVQRYIYDVFGPTLAVAEANRACAAPMTITADASIADLLDSRFALSAVAAPVADPGDEIARYSVSDAQADGAPDS